MSSLNSQDEAPFVFGAYASHVSDVPATDCPEADVAEAPLPGPADVDLAALLSQLPNLATRR